MAKQVENGVLINLRIVPNSSRNDILQENGFIKVKITAPPIEGKANKALVEFLSKKFKIPKTSIEIIKGETSKDKTLLLKTSDKIKCENIMTMFK